MNRGKKRVGLPDDISSDAIRSREAQISRLDRQIGALERRFTKTADPEQGDLIALELERARIQRRILDHSNNRDRERILRTLSHGETMARVTVPVLSE